MENQSEFEDMLKELEAKVLKEKQKEEWEQAKEEAERRYGDVTDPSNPLLTPPTEREALGLTAEERVTYLEKEAELMRTGMARLLDIVSELRAELKIMDLRQRNPEAAALLDQLMDARAANRIPSNLTPQVVDANKEPVPPGAMLPTVNGMVRADSIPGYRNEPGWAPSEEWADENCGCPIHVEKRKNKGTGSDGTGLYI